MSKAEQFIKDYTRGCSNVVYYHSRNFTHGTDYVEGSGIEVQYSPWLTPDQALRAVEIARNEMLDKVCSYLFREEYASLEFVRRLYNANCVYQPF